MWFDLFPSASSRSDFDSAHLLWKYQKGSSSKQYSSWTYSLISCIISSKTFVTDTTYIGFQFGFFLFFLGMIPAFHSCFFVLLNILHNILLLKKVWCLRQKVFLLHLGGANVYYFLKEVSGCLCGHPQREQNWQVYRIQVWNDSKLFQL